MIKNIKRRILVAPLDWGLGHTSRCVPIIRWILHLGHAVIVAGNEQQKAFLAKTTSGVEFVHLDGYNIRYAAGAGGKLKILSQVPAISQHIAREHDWLCGQMNNLKADGIISDNRYGLYHPQVPSVIITHQLMVQTGLGKRADRVVQKMHYKYLEKFGAVWVPDTAGEGNIGGMLSQTAELPHNTSYIGHLSQFEGLANDGNNEGYLLVLLSGPEPQRTILSQILLLQLAAYKGKVILVSGADGQRPAGIASNITFFGRLSGGELGALISRAELVICRSGYSTIMDLVLLGKRAIVIPTPGQTEQEYLGQYLHERGIFYCVAQKNLDINKAMAQAKRFPFFQVHLPGNSFGLYRAALSRLLALC